MQLTCLEDTAQNYPSFVLLTFLKYIPLSYLYHAKYHSPRARQILPLRKWCTLSTLHRIPNCVKIRTTRNCILQLMSASCCSVAYNYFHSGLRIMFTTFLETKTQLWKLMSSISGVTLEAMATLCIHL